MKLRYFLIGLILIILGFSSFAVIAIANQYTWMNLSTHIIITVIGFILIFLGIISMIFFIKEDKKNKKDNVKSL